ncbi:MAG: thiolase family protein [Chloroflexi bacterium]|nr:thiolase family protein [Chloroflexota bacterium]
MSLRGKTAIVGFGEIPTERNYPGRTTESLCTEVARIAIEDAGLRKSDIDGLITREENNPLDVAQHMGIHPVFAQGMTLHGASGAASVMVAASAIYAGLATNVLCVLGATRDPEVGGAQPGAPRVPPPVSYHTEWEDPYGPVIAANGHYALLKRRHMHEFGTTDEQFAKIAVDERFNALLNPNAVWRGVPQTLEDVLKSRYVAEPLHLLECVMPCAGAGAVIVTSAERAKAMPNPPVYILGAGGAATNRSATWQAPEMTTTPVVMSAPRAFQMSRYSPKDMQFAEFYD